MENGDTYLFYSFVHFMYKFVHIFLRSALFWLRLRSIYDIWYAFGRIFNRFWNIEMKNMQNVHRFL